MRDDTFEIGLVGAGAISAGAYSAGVFDFLTFALDCWYEEKDKATSKIPSHDVKLSVFAGASAGGITAALAAGYLGSNQPPITNKEEGERLKGENKLFDSWVERIDIEHLLGSRDLPTKKSPVVSLLDSTVLSEIADAGLDVVPRPSRRPYIAEDFHLLLSVTNLRGIPYSISLQGGGEDGHPMTMHADYVHFTFRDADKPCPVDRYPLTWSELGTNHSNKGLLKQSALASGAFPIGLAPRSLAHGIPGNGEPDYYSGRMWPVPTPDSKDPHQCTTGTPIPAHWGYLPPYYRYDFQCVDGGVTNNEPLELARRILAGHGGRNARKGKEAKKAVIMIDPFPGVSKFKSDYKTERTLLSTAGAIFKALKNHARFKPDELMLAADKDIRSRFMIAPSRNGNEHPIACGSLDGFGGFLKRDFREHDYFLGRRNAQKFLTDHFVLPEDNSLFDSWGEGVRKDYCLKVGGIPLLDENQQRLLPVIPLVGRATDECQQLPWPQYTAEDSARLSKQMSRRTTAVLKHSWTIPVIGGFVMWFLRRAIVKRLMHVIENNLRDAGLIQQ